MKIAHIVCVYPPYGGGIGVACRRQVESLAKQGHQVTVFTPKYNANQKNNTSKNLEIKRIKPFFKFGNAAILLKLFGKLKEYDLIQLHLPFIGSTFIVWLWKKIFGVKKELVVFYHMDLVGSGFKGFLFKVYSSIFLPLILKLADKIIVASEDYIENSDIAKFYHKNKQKFLIKPYLIDTVKFYPQERDISLCQKLAIKSEAKTALFVASLDAAHYFKGLTLLLRAWQKLKFSNKKLIVVGKGELLDFYRNLAQDLGIEKEVIFVGYVTDEELVKYYNSADVFVLPSIDKSEAFGLVTLEAQACGVPAVISNLPGVRKVIKEGKTGFVFEVNNVDDLSSKLKVILTDKKLAQDFAQAARARVEDKFSLAKNKFNYE